MTQDSLERQSVEVEGHSIDDAIERALRDLGVTRDKVEIEILSHRPRGLFGLGRRRASVRATLRRPLALRATSPGPSQPTAVASATDAPHPAGAPAGAAGRLKSMPADGADAAPDTALLSRARGVLQEIVRLTGSTASVEIAPDPTGPHLVIASDADAVLIGRRGQTLDALEYVLNRILAHADASSPALTIDLQGYRLRRRQSLEALAQRAAARARANGRPVTLNPMSPRDRRIVHLALRHAGALTTRSAGTGFYRRVLIVPAGRQRAGRARSAESS